MGSPHFEGTKSCLEVSLKGQGTILNYANRIKQAQTLQQMQGIPTKPYNQNAKHQARFVAGHSDTD
jgi:hypothetical protein